jgi:hypothetical protein
MLAIICKTPLTAQDRKRQDSQCDGHVPLISKDLPQHDILIVFRYRAYHANSQATRRFERVIGFAARVRGRGNGFDVSKVVQLCASSAARFGPPTTLQSDER